MMQLPAMARPRKTSESNAQTNPSSGSSRNYWCEIVQESKNQNDDSVYEDPSQAYERLLRADNAEGTSAFIAHCTISQ